jgi:hypothetical protein
MAAEEDELVEVAAKGAFEDVKAELGEYRKRGIIDNNGSLLRRPKQGDVLSD